MQKMRKLNEDIVDSIEQEDDDNASKIVSSKEEYNDDLSDFQYVIKVKYDMNPVKFILYDGFKDSKQRVAVIKSMFKAYDWFDYIFSAFSFVDDYAIRLEFGINDLQFMNKTIEIESEDGRTLRLHHTTQNVGDKFSLSVGYNSSGLMANQIRGFLNAVMNTDKGGT